MYHFPCESYILAKIAHTWLRFGQLKGCHLHTKTRAAGHLEAGVELLVVEFAAGAVSAMCKDYHTNEGCWALTGTSRWVKVPSGE